MHSSRFRTVVLATDLSPTSEAATTAALDLSATVGARLLAVSVIDPGSLRLPGGRYFARVDPASFVRTVLPVLVVVRAGVLLAVIAKCTGDAPRSESISESGLPSARLP